MLLLVVLLASAVAAQLNVHESHMHKTMDEIHNHAAQVLESSRIHGVQVRQCTCAEQTRCVEQIQNQARGCAKDCWSVFNKVASNPAAMYECAKQNEDLITGGIGCMTKQMNSCLKTHENKMIQKTDISKLLHQIEERIVQNEEKIMRDPLVSQMKDLADATMKFGTCVKKCLIQKHQLDGSCFDQAACQPHVDSQHFEKAARRCTHAIHEEFKQRSQQLCDCGERAGIRSTHSSCAVIKTMASFTHKHSHLEGVGHGPGLLNSLGGRK